MKTKIIFLMTLLLCTTPLFAAAIQDPDLTNPVALVAYLTTAVVWFITFIVQKFAPSIPDTILLLIVLVLSALIPFLNTALLTPDLSWLEQFGLGIASTFAHQFHKKITEFRN